MLELSHKVTRSEQAAAEPLHDEHIILDLNSGEYFGTGNVGGFIWQNLDGAQPLQKLAEAVALRFDVDEQQAGADLLSFVSQLIERGLAHKTD